MCDKITKGLLTVLVPRLSTVHGNKATSPLLNVRCVWTGKNLGCCEMPLEPPEIKGVKLLIAYLSFG